MRLSATGDPEEALAKQRQNKAARTMVDAALSIPALKGTQLGIQALMKGSKFARGTRDALAAGAGLPFVGAKKMAELAAPFKFNPKFVTNPKAGQPKKDIFGKPVMKDGKPVMETAKKLEQRSIFDPKSYETGGVQVKPFTTGLYATPVLLEGRSRLLDVVTQEPEMAEIMDREVEVSPNTIQEDLDDLGTPTPSPTPTPAPEEVVEEEPEEQVQEEPQGQEKAQRTANSLSNFFSSDSFNSALRNIGSSLVREGRFGAGLAAGAAGFAEEQEAKRLLEEERMAKLFEAQAKGGMSFSDQLSLDKAVNEKQLALAGNVRDFNNAQAAYQLAQSVIDLANGNENLASFGSKIGATVDNLLAGAGLKDLSEYENLTDTEKARIALNELTNRNIKEILGESGRTISNIDRDIAKRVVGTLDIQDIKSVASLKKTLQNNIEMITEKGNEAQRQIAANSGFLLKYIPTLFKNDPELLEILRKDFGAPSDNITTQDIGNLKPRVVKTTLRG